MYNNYFEYRNGELFWKVKPSKKIQIGEKVGTLKRGTTVNENPYYVLHLNKKQLYLHRVIWEMHNGAIPENMQIDHIFHNTLDNRIENLRLVALQENYKNRSKMKKNTSGYTGILYDKRYKTNPWKVQIGKYYKHLPTLELAIIHRDEKYIEFGFHENHGK